MSVYPLYLVLGSDGTIGAYAREDILRIDLAQNKNAGHPARQVYRLDEHRMTVTYKPALEFGEFIVAYQDLCQTHQAAAALAMFPGRAEVPACASCPASAVLTAGQKG
jgi:hypothetical protein